VKLGDNEDNVIKLHGTLTSSKTIPGGKKILTYTAIAGRKDVIVKNLVLHIEISNGTVSSFHLLGDVPGAKNPFNNLKVTASRSSPALYGAGLNLLLMWRQTICRFVPYVERIMTPACFVSIELAKCFEI